MSHRTWGDTKNCKGCRFWSEMVARSRGGGPIEAMCLVQNGPFSGKYTVGSQTCPKWKSGHFGAIDDPEETISLYEDEEKQS